MIDPDDILDAAPASASERAWEVTGPMVEDVVATFAGRHLEVIQTLADPTWDAVLLAVDDVGETAIYLVTLSQFA